jgi:hypothetical protein
VAVIAGLVIELVLQLPALQILSIATAIAFPAGRALDYALTIRDDKPARDLRRILGAP